MSPLITRLVQQFRSKSQYDHFIRECQQKFDINPYRFQHITPSMIRKSFNQLQQKYQQDILHETRRNWHQNQRKVFVWFLLAFIKYLKDNNNDKNHHYYQLQQQHWQELSQTFFNKDQLFLKYQYKSIQKIRRKRQQWTQVEDDILKSCQQHIENANWNEIAKEIYFRTNGQSYKSSKQCRQRWQNHLDNKIRKQGWQVSEDLAILEFVLENGKRWSKIVEKLQNTRTQHMVKNRFKSLLVKSEGRNKKQDGQKNNGQGQGQETQLIQHIIKGLKQRISSSSITTRHQVIQQQNQQKRQQQYQQKQPTIESLQMQLQINDKENKEEQQQQQQQEQQQQEQDVKTNIKQQKRSHGMMILRGDSVEFVNSNNNNNNSNNSNNEKISIFIQSQPQQPPFSFNIFQCPSPATLSLASSGFLLSSSYSSFTPPSIAMGNNRNNLSFSSFHQHWERNNRVQQKGSISSDVGSNNTSRLIECSRREDNLLFSLEFNNLLNSNNNNISNNNNHTNTNTNSNNQPN